MSDVARDPAALELLRVRRNRLASRFPGTGIWPAFVTAAACLLRWGMARTTGLKTGYRNVAPRGIRHDLRAGGGAA